jgi:hypothetical protein
MAKVVQDESGQLFVDQGGGSLTPVTEEQATAFLSGQGVVGGAVKSAEQGFENLVTGAGTLLSDDPAWQQANQAGRARSEALNLANPVTGPIAQGVPQAIGGLAAAAAAPEGLAGYGVVAGAEGLLGALTTPESPATGAVVGGLLGAAGQGAPGALSWLGQKARPAGEWATSKLPFGGKAAPVDAAEPAMFPGYMRAGEAVPGAGPGSQPGAAATDSMAPSPESQWPSTPPDPMELLRARAAELDARDATAKGRQAAQAPGNRGGGDGGFIEGEPGPPLPDPAPSPSANPPNAPPGTPPNPTPRMAERVTNRLQSADEASAPTLRALEGTLSPEHLQILGIETSDAQKALLRAKAGTGEHAAALQALRREHHLMSQPTPEGNARNALDMAQKEAGTNYVTRELELPPGVHLTDQVLADTMANVGSQMDDIATQMGTVPLTQEIRNEFASIAENSTGSYGGQIKDVIRQVEDMATLNNGVITGDQWTEVRSRLAKMMQWGTGAGEAGKIHAAGQLMDTMTEAMESQLPDEIRGELQKLRRQYAIGSTLQKAGTRDADGLVNPVSFYSRWKAPQSKTRRGVDDLGQFMSTMVTLTKKRAPDSGTTGRWLQALVDMGLDMAGPAGAVAKRVKNAVKP